MSRTLPYHSKRPGNHQHKEEALQNNRNLLQIIPIHIHPSERRNHTTPSHKQHPIPLPPSSNNPKPLILPHMQLPMFPQIDQRKHNRYPKRRPKQYTGQASLPNPIIWRVARRRIDPAAIAEHMRTEVAKDKVTFRRIGDGVIAVECVVVEVERCSVEVDSIHDDICRVISGEFVQAHDIS